MVVVVVVVVILSSCCCWKLWKKLWWWCQVMFSFLCRPLKSNLYTFSSVSIVLYCIDGIVLTVLYWQHCIVFCLLFVWWHGHISRLTWLPKTVQGTGQGRQKEMKTEYEKGWQRRRERASRDCRAKALRSVVLVSHESRCSLLVAFQRSVLAESAELKQHNCLC